MEMEDILTEVQLTSLIQALLFKIWDIPMVEPRDLNQDMVLKLDLHLDKQPSLMEMEDILMEVQLTNLIQALLFNMWGILMVEPRDLNQDMEDILMEVLLTNLIQAHHFKMWDIPMVEPRDLNQDMVLKLEPQMDKEPILMDMEDILMEVQLTSLIQVPHCKIWGIPMVELRDLNQDMVLKLDPQLDKQPSLMVMVFLDICQKDLIKQQIQNSLIWDNQMDRCRELYLQSLIVDLEDNLMGNGSNFQVLGIRMEKEKLLHNQAMEQEWVVIQLMLDHKVSNQQDLRENLKRNMELVDFHLVLPQMDIKQTPLDNMVMMVSAMEPNPTILKRLENTDTVVYRTTLSLYFLNLLPGPLVNTILAGYPTMASHMDMDKRVFKMVVSHLISGLMLCLENMVKVCASSLFPVGSPESLYNPETISFGGDANYGNPAVSYELLGPVTDGQSVDENRSLETLHQGPEIDGQKAIDQYGDGEVQPHPDAPEAGYANAQSIEKYGKEGKYKLSGFFGNKYQGIPFICFLLFLPVNIPWAEVDEWWIGVVHYLACLSPTICSVFYHLFMNHEGGAHVYDTLLCFDMVGVCLVNTLGALPIIYITLLCNPSSRCVAMLAYLLLSGYGVYCAVTARDNVHRLQSFAWQALFRFVLFLLRLTGAGKGSPASLRLYLTMDALALVGGLVNISRLPERFSPGRFDYWLNSHQIMHIMVILSILYLHWGTLEDLKWLKVYHCPGE
ncbi:progestin and adipoQ receptor family [Pimephales promelas]|nr:progestin and adipoQ receptor family [Pimephales promelas]KAG1941188.1 progestin and adipoQ receptor family [Pimephales promelas]